MEDLVGFCYFLPKSKVVDSGNTGTLDCFAMTEALDSCLRRNDRVGETTSEVMQPLLVGASR
jgi:hypothetical protein